MGNIKGSYRYGNSNTHRRCCICKIVKTIDCFCWIKKENRWKYICKECDNEKSRLYYNNNKIKVSNRIRNYCLQHKEMRQESVLRWRLNHPEKWIEVRKISNLNAKIRRLGLDNKISVNDWEEIKKKYNYTCANPKCGKKEPDIKLSIDHIIPITKGGNNSLSNIQPLCRSCNCKKYNKIIRYAIPII